MIKLIIGLGNPGKQYEKTRHNAGFLFLDVLASESGCKWTYDSRFQGLYAEYSAGMQKVILLKPETYMNRSGQSVGKVVRYYKLVPDEILVVHDELDFAAGVLKLKKNGGHAGHNGLRDIIAHLGTNQFYRLRVGIGRPENGRSVADFVLSAPSRYEWELMVSSFARLRLFLGKIISGEIEAVMNEVNAGV
ncbi:MAG: aminoacyl-tRNA hydrolase [Methylococcaceae bacterium]|nr:aminoacyl-tRNA hydrolase [Methylococcaceae bacterium]